MELFKHSSEYTAIIYVWTKSWYSPFKPPLGNGLSSLALTTMSFKFLGRLNAAIGGSLKSFAILSLL
jgi:hypothetical protein